MWISVPDYDEEKEHWVGKLEKHDVSNSVWQIELGRSVDFKDIYNESPLNRDYVIGIIDHQKKCTLIRPFISDVNPGSLGQGVIGSRTILKGHIQALLTDIAIDDGDEKIFKKISFKSDSFRTWYRRRSFDTKFDRDIRSYKIDIKNTQATSYNICDFGKITCTTYSKISGKDQKKIVSDITEFVLEFESNASLKEVQSYCFELEILFGFLIGFRIKPPNFQLVTLIPDAGGGRNILHKGVLEINGFRWKSDDPPHPMECAHLRGQGGAGLDTILNNFRSQKESINQRIYAIEFSLFFSNDLNAKFAIIMPTFEQYIKNRFTNSEESSYIQFEKDFFAWVDISKNANIIEFAKKHLSVKKRKSPSLPTIIARAIDYLNNKSFNFSLDLAGKINNRRGAIFHSVPKMEIDDIYRYHHEINAITAMLMLLTFDDLGIDIRYLNHQSFFIRNFGSFVKRPSSTDIIRKTKQATDGQTPTNIDISNLTKDDLYGPLSE